MASASISWQIDCVVRLLSTGKRTKPICKDPSSNLIDSNSVIERAWREAAQMYDKEISNDDMIKHIHGHPGAHTIAALFGDLSAADQQKVQDHIICRKYSYL